LRYTAGPTAASPQPRGAPARHMPSREAARGNQALLRRLQAKLTIGAVDDPLEHEADAVADQVMRMPDPARATEGAPPRISRKCEACEEEDKVQTKRAGTEAAAEAPASVQTALDSPGVPLDAGTRGFFEPRLGADLSRVRLHTDAKAAESARSIGALAYTVGNDVAFGANQFSPGSDAGRRLLAHELTHTLQQNEGNIRRAATMNFDPALVAEQLRDAMKGLGTDEDRIYAAMSGRSQAQLDQITAAYLKLTGNDLAKDLQSELNSKELTKLGALAPLAGKDDPVRRAQGVATQLREAMSHWITDKTSIFAALEGRSPADLAEIKTAYMTLTKNDLEADLRKNLKGDDLQKALGEMGTAPDVYVKNTELGGLTMGNFDLHFKNCEITAWCWLHFNFSDNITPVQQGRFKTRFINAVETVWGNSGYKLTGTGACPCADVPIKVHLQENPGKFAHKRVDVESPSVPAGSTDKGNDQDRARRPKVISDINVNFCTHDLTFAHEFGHVLGLYDEYDGGFFENIMFWHKNVNDPNALMNVGTELRPRYFEQYRKEAEKTAPHGCKYSVTAPPTPAVNPAPAVDPDC